MCVCVCVGEGEGGRVMTQHPQAAHHSDRGWFWQQLENHRGGWEGRGKVKVERGCVCGGGGGGVCVCVCVCVSERGWGVGGVMTQHPQAAHHSGGGWFWQQMEGHRGGWEGGRGRRR